MLMLKLFDIAYTLLCASTLELVITRINSCLLTSKAIA